MGNHKNTGVKKVGGEQIYKIYKVIKSPSEDGHRQEEGSSCLCSALVCLYTGDDNMSIETSVDQTFFLTGETKLLLIETAAWS